MTDHDEAIVKEQARIITRRGLLAALASDTVNDPDWCAENLVQDAAAQRAAEVERDQNSNTTVLYGSRGDLPRRARSVA